jgi:hypothetical protein
MRKGVTSRFGVSACNVGVILGLLQANQGAKPEATRLPDFQLIPKNISRATVDELHRFKALIQADQA